MEKGHKVKLMKLSNYELGETLGTGISFFYIYTYKSSILFYIPLNRFIRSSSYIQK